jgi:hypothetical protein
MSCSLLTFMLQYAINTMNVPFWMSVSCRSCCYLEVNVAEKFLNSMDTLFLWISHVYGLIFVFDLSHRPLVEDPSNLFKLLCFRFTNVLKHPCLLWWVLAVLNSHTLCYAIYIFWWCVLQCYFPQTIKVSTANLVILHMWRSWNLRCWLL